MPRPIEHPFSPGDEFFCLVDDGILILHRIKEYPPEPEDEIFQVIRIIAGHILMAKSVNSDEIIGFSLDMDLASDDFPFRDIYIQDGYPFE